MGLLSKGSKRLVKEQPGKNVHQRSLPPDKSSIASGPEKCHCVSEAELERRYNILRLEEHARVDNSAVWSRRSAQSSENASRNRYANILPWDHSRVVLPVPEGTNDYINASWIQLGDRTYIASQGPTPGTIEHFWHMVYAYGGDPAVVVMLTPLHEQGVEKCAKYWPNKGEEMTVKLPDVGPLKISCDKYSGNDHYNYAVIRLIPEDPSMPEHLVHHIYYYSWLDYTRPNADADLRGLIFMINNKIRNPGAPLVVHCSAGIGRTGTFIAIDALMVDADNELQSTVPPNVSPVWRDQAPLQYRSTLFEESTTTSFGVVEEADNSADLNNAISSLPGSPLGAWNGPHGQAPLANGAPEGVDGVDGADGAPHADPCASDSTLAPQKSPVREASALTGPVFARKKSASAQVDRKWLNITPQNINVYDVLNPQEDKVMSVLRYMRMQRPKMVQGVQQLGYIYDQLEVAEQLIRTSGRTERVARRETMDMGEHFQKSARSDSTASSQKSAKSAAGRLLARVPTFSQLSSKR